MSLTSFAVKNYQFTIILFVLALALGANASAPKSPMFRLAIALPGATAQPRDFKH